jgi:dTMP kinase
MTDTPRGLLITLEGGEGAGKTTAQTFIHDWLVAEGRSVTTTREPGGTPLAEGIRDMLLDKRGDMAPPTELLLMFAARAENIAKIIEPALAKGHDVLCDRFTDASRAYQGAGRQLGLSSVDALAEWVHPTLRPDLTLLLDVPVAVGMERVGKRGAALNRFEMADVEFFERVRQGYLDQATREPDRFVVIDATQSIDTVQSKIKDALLELVVRGPHG